MAQQVRLVAVLAGEGTIARMFVEVAQQLVSCIETRLAVRTGKGLRLQMDRLMTFQALFEGETLLTVAALEVARLLVFHRVHVHFFLREKEPVAVLALESGLVYMCLLVAMQQSRSTE